jgi:hypothetical protein
MAASPLDVWPVRGQAARLACMLLVLLFALYDGAFLSAYLLRNAQLSVDFFGFWSSTRYVTGHPAAGVYDPALVDAFQHSLDPSLNGRFPFLYPPSLLLLMAPLAALPYAVARALWTLGSLAAWLAAIAAPRWRRNLLSGALVAPATAIALFYGQTGLFAAALLIGGLRLLPARPVLAGVLLGVLTVKPQYGVLVPAALLAAGQWRAIAAATLTFLATVGASMLAFGAAIWSIWLHSLAVNAPIPAADRLRLDALMPTLAGNLDLIGVPPTPAHLAQAALALACMGLIWRLWRRRCGVLPVAAVAAAALLATPYGFVYDMPLAAGAVALTFADAADTGRPLGLGETAVLAVAMAMPVEIFTPAGPALPLGALSLVALFAVILRRGLRPA